MIATESPFPQYFDTDGTALDAGYIYFGVAGQNPETSPITVYWDFAGTTPAAQPIRTSNGYTVRDGTPAVVYATGDYSLTVRKKTGALVYSAPSSAYFGNAYSLSQLGANLAASSGSSLVGFLQSGVGAVARTVQDKLRDLVSAYDVGLKGDDTTDNSPLLAAALAASLGVNKTLYFPSTGKFYFSQAIDLTGYAPTYLNNTTPGQMIWCDGVIRSGATDRAIKATGNFLGHKIFIKKLIGPGVGTPGTIGAGAEGIGFWIGPNSGMDVTIDELSDFTIGFCIDGGYMNRVNLGMVYACNVGVSMRNSAYAPLGYDCAINTVNVLCSGGPYYDPSSGVNAALAARTCHIGLWMDNRAQHNTVTICTEYSSRDATAIGMLLEGDNNDIYCYMEGAQANQQNWRVTGNNNTLSLNGGNSQSIQAASMSVTGVGNVISHLGQRQISTQVATSSPHGGQGEFQIAEGNIVAGGVVERDVDIISPLANNIIASAAPSATSVTITSAVADRPQAFDSSLKCIEVTSATNSLGWATYGSVSVAGETRTKVKVGFWVRGLTNSPKVSIFLLDQAGTVIASLNTAVRATGAKWKKLEFMADIGSATALFLRIAGRNFTSGETGWALRAFNPYISFNVGSSEPAVYGANISPTKGQGYTAFQDGTHFDWPQRKRYGNVSLPGTNVLATASLPFAVINSVTGGAVVNSITGVNDGAEVRIANGTASNITFTTLAGSWANFNLLPGTYVCVFNAGGTLFAK